MSDQWHFDPSDRSDDCDSHSMKSYVSRTTQVFFPYSTYISALYSCLKTESYCNYDLLLF